MSRLIAVHVVAGILLVAVGTADAQESIPRQEVVEARDPLTSTGVLPTRNDVSGPKNDTLEPGVCPDDPNDNIEGRQNSARSSQDAGDSPQAKTGTARRWFSGAMFWTVEFLAKGLAVYLGGR